MSTALCCNYLTVAAHVANIYRCTAACFVQWRDTSLTSHAAGNCRGVLSNLKEVNEQPIGGGRSGFSLESESSNDEVGLGGFGTTRQPQLCSQFLTWLVTKIQSCGKNRAGAPGAADDNTSTNDDGGGDSSINGAFDEGEQEKMEDEFAALSASGGDHAGSGGESKGAFINDGANGAGGDTGGGVDTSFSSLRPDDDGTV